MMKLFTYNKVKTLLYLRERFLVCKWSVCYGAVADTDRAGLCIGFNITGCSINDGGLCCDFVWTVHVHVAVKLDILFLRLGNLSWVGL